MESHNQRGGQFIGFPILDADSRVDTSEDVGLYRIGKEFFFHLRQYHHAGFVLVFVLCGKDLFHFVVQLVLAADAHHLFDDFIVIQPLERLAVNVVFLVRAAQYVQTHRLNVVVLEIELHGSSCCCYICHND